ncbi:MAG: FAD-binding protein [Thermodesulfobacteriota bacterium]|nr:FAD-binding protein [Thermodesulfobacteriota bacterium]
MNFNEETEILIIGYGGAGAVAAITAYDLDSSVLIVEKMEKGGGNTNISLGGFLSIKDLEGGLLYLENLFYRVARAVDAEIVYTYAQECAKNKEWLENLGAKTHVYGGAAFSQLSGCEAIEKRMITGVNTVEENSFWNFLRTHVERRQIPIWNNTRAKELVTDNNGVVIGASLEKEKKEIKIKAKKAVILTCGGFEFDDWMKMNYLKGYPYHSFGSPGNTGDGLRMAQRVGADLWHTSSVSAPLGFKALDFEAAFMSRTSSSRYIYVDRQGKRFASEVADIHAYNFIVDFFDPATLEYPRIPCFMIFDEAACKSGPMGITAVGYNRGKYNWSKDNSDEINRGWIAKGETLADLSGKIQINPVILEKTVTQYNKYCEIGKDWDYHRPKDNMEPIGPGPFYAMKLWPCLLNTQGGPKRNAKAQILYPDGRSIPRLYGAGELGSIFGLLYQGAGNLGECLAFGRIAGREAAKERESN